MDKIPQFEGKTTSQGQSSPFVSVVIPVYNGSRTIAACIKSLLALDYPSDRYEIIVVDNNSTDGTGEIVQEYPVKLLYERGVQTSYAARNTGIRHAKGEIIAFTDADCIADENWLRELVAPFADPQVGGVGGRVLGHSPTNMVESFLCSLKLFSRYQKDDVFLPVLLTTNTAYRRECLWAAGLFNQNLFTGSDVDLSWRVQLRTRAKVTYAPQAIVYHKHRATMGGMFKQFRRHGFGEILLDAMYKEHPSYRRTPIRQLRRIGSQLLALVTYIRSFCYRLLLWKLKGKDRLYVVTPVLWFVAEGANVWGKMQGIWATRLFKLNPEGQLREDPGER